MPSTRSPPGKSSVSRRDSSSHCGWICIIEPSRLPAYSAPLSSRSQKRRFPRTPPASSSTSFGWTSASDFTGATEMRTTRPSTPSGYICALDLHLGPPARAFEAEDPEVAPDDVDGDVVHGHLSYLALEGSGVGMPVQDQIGTVLRDRRREPIAAEQHVQPERLAFECRLDRGVVEQHDAQVAM